MSRKCALFIGLIFIWKVCVPMFYYCNHRNKNVSHTMLIQLSPPQACHAYMQHVPVIITMAKCTSCCNKNPQHMARLRYNRYNITYTDIDFSITRSLKACIRSTVGSFESTNLKLESLSGDINMRCVKYAPVVLNSTASLTTNKRC